MPTKQIFKISSLYLLMLSFAMFFSSSTLAAGEEFLDYDLHWV